jgi:YhcH/YjgK/YiaL family protein
MVIDTLDNADGYCSLHPGIALALEFLRRPETARLEPLAWGPENSLRHEIDGSRVFALIQRYQTKRVEETFWEAHRKHIDVQCVLEGTETMGWAPLSMMKVTQPYDAEKDYAKLDPQQAGAANFLTVAAGMFAVFMPNDAHMPGLTAPLGGEARPVKKIVVKVCV